MQRTIMTGRRMLFLDFDGVLCTDRYADLLQEQGKETRDADGALFDPEAVENLRNVVESTQCVIVVTSTWRISGEERITQLWEHRNMPGKLIGVTPVMLHATYQNPRTKELMEKPEWETKGYEVNTWLEINAEPKDLFAIVDDENPFLHRQQERLVQTHESEGLTKEAAKKIIDKLTR